MQPLHSPRSILSLALLTLAAAADLAAQQRPNILFVFSDDHAPHAIGAYGGRLAGLDPTPNIDALAADGVLFRNAFCTNSLCGPSRAVILTGKHSHVNGFRRNGERFDPDQPTFPKLLQKAGYRTALIGKWHLNSDPQGFDYWDVLPGQGAYYNPVMINAAGKREIEGYCTDVVTDLAVEWLEQNKGSDQPWMLMCQHKAPHRNWMPAPRHLRLYAGVEIPKPATLFDQWLDNASPARAQEMTIDRHMNLVYDLFVDPDERFAAGSATDRSGHANLRRMTPEQRQTWIDAFAPENAAFRSADLSGRALVEWKYQRYMRNYLACIKGVDESLGRLRQWLADHELAGNTIVIYSSDQGFYLGDHGWYDKRWMYEESMKMPLVVHWPGVTDGGREETRLVQNIDYAETFLDLAHAAIPDDMQGVSLVPLLRGAGTELEWRDALYYHYYEFPAVHQVACHYGVRTERYKLMHFYQTDEWELYDLVRDPDELHNVYDDPAYHGVITNLAVRLGELRAQYGDTTKG